MFVRTTLEMQLLMRTCGEVTRSDHANVVFVPSTRNMRKTSQPHGEQALSRLSGVEWREWLVLLDMGVTCAWVFHHTVERRWPSCAAQ